MNGIDDKLPEEMTWRKLENNIRMDVEDIRCEIVCCIHSAQDRDQYQNLVNMVTVLRIPKKRLRIS
jgi:hypothetical protein